MAKKERNKEHLTEQEKFILRMECITNWDWNDDFLEFWDRFYKNKDYKHARRVFNYYANKLVKKGYLERAKRYGIGLAGFSDYGTRTQTIWNLKV